MNFDLFGWEAQHVNQLVHMMQRSRLLVLFLKKLLKFIFRETFFLLIPERTFQHRRPQNRFYFHVFVVKLMRNTSLRLCCTFSRGCSRALLSSHTARSAAAHTHWSQVRGGSALANSTKVMNQHCCICYHGGHTHTHTHTHTQTHTHVQRRQITAALRCL